MNKPKTHLAILAALLWVGACLGVTIDFKDASIIVGPNAYLKDVAEIESASPALVEQIGELVVSKRILAGKTRSLSTDRIKALCRRRFSRHQFKFSNEVRINVLRDSRQINGSEIAEAVENFILSNMPWEKRNAEILLTRYPDNITISNTKYNLRVSNAGYGFIGSGTLDIEVLYGDEVKAAFPVSLKMQVFQDVCVAKERIGRKEPISPAKISIERRNITRLRNRYFISPDGLKGRYAKRNIGRNRIIDGSMVAAPPLVQCGDQVDVNIERGSVRISVEGICRSDGRVGDTIPIYCSATKKIIKGTILPNGSITLNKRRRNI